MSKPMKQAQDELQKEVAGWLENAVRRGADRIQVLWVRANGSVQGSLFDIDPQVLKDAAGATSTSKVASYAGEIAKKTFRITKDKKVTQQYVFAWSKKTEVEGDPPVVEQEPFLTQFEVEDEDADIVDESPTREGVLAMTMRMLNDERKHSRKLLNEERNHTREIIGKFNDIVDRSYGIMSESNAHLQSEIDLHRTNQITVVKEVYALNEQKHKFALEEKKIATADARADKLIEAGKEIVAPLMPFIAPKIAERMFGGPVPSGATPTNGAAPPTGTGGNPPSGAGGPNDAPPWFNKVMGEFANEVNGLFTKQQTMINGLGEAVAKTAAVTERVVNVLEQRGIQVREVPALPPPAPAQATSTPPEVPVTETESESEKPKKRPQPRQRN